MKKLSKEDIHTMHNGSKSTELSELWTMHSRHKRILKNMHQKEKETRRFEQ